jgi:hypothetical protein
MIAPDPCGLIQTNHHRRSPAGKKLDMGKSCLRFKDLDDLPLDATERIVAAVPVDDFIARYEASRRH